MALGFSLPQLWLLGMNQWTEGPCLCLSLLLCLSNKFSKIYKKNLWPILIAPNAPTITAFFRVQVIMEKQEFQDWGSQQEPWVCTVNPLGSENINSQATSNYRLHPPPCVAARPQGVILWSNCFLIPRDHISFPTTSPSSPCGCCHHRHSL